MRCDLDVQIRSIKVHRPLQNSRTSLCGTNSVILSPPISRCLSLFWCAQTKCSALQEWRTKCAASFTTRCLPHTANRLSTHLTESSPRVAGPERTFFGREPRNLARGSDVDCLIRHKKFEILASSERSSQGPSLPSLEKKKAHSLW
jgi:hypothetical protein